MPKQTFTSGQVLTAAQMTSLQQTAMLGGAASAKTASYTLVAADAGTAISMSNASATTITVNTALFAAGDTVQITNLGAGVCTITAGTATVNTASSLALAQYESGTLDFTSTSAAIFIKGAGAAAGGGKVLQVVMGTTNTGTSIASTSFTDTTLTATITPSSATSKVLVLYSQQYKVFRGQTTQGAGLQLLRGATSIQGYGVSGHYAAFTFDGVSSGGAEFRTVTSGSYLDSPATTSSTTYKIQLACLYTSNSGSIYAQEDSSLSNMILLEIGA
jgi:hypothetical protein